MLTGWGDGRVAAEAMHSGAYDYFPKSSINSQVLAHAIHQALDKHRWSVEERRLREELERLVITDELTSVYNRRYMAQALDRECNRARRYRRDLACLMIDLDDFKRYNDNHGHLVGDTALKQVAANNQPVRSRDRHCDPLWRRGVRRHHAGSPSGRVHDRRRAYSRGYRRPGALRR